METFVKFGFCLHLRNLELGSFDTKTNFCQQLSSQYSYLVIHLLNFLAVVQSLFMSPLHRSTGELVPKSLVNSTDNMLASCSKKPIRYIIRYRLDQLHIDIEGR